MHGWAGAESRGLPAYPGGWGRLLSAGSQTLHVSLFPHRAAVFAEGVKRVHVGQAPARCSCLWLPLPTQGSLTFSPQPLGLPLPVGTGHRVRGSRRTQPTGHLPARPGVPQTQPGVGNIQMLPGGPNSRPCEQWSWQCLYMSMREVLSQNWVPGDPDCRLDYSMTGSVFWTTLSSEAAGIEIEGSVLH